MSTSVSPDARRIWRAARIPAAIVLVMVAVGIVTVLSRGSQTHGDLEPDSYEPGGSHAIEAVLASHGVRVATVRTVADAIAASPGATLFVTDPQQVPTAKLGQLLTSASGVVLVAPDADTAKAVSPALDLGGESGVSVRSPGCEAASAVAAGAVGLGGIRYETKDIEDDTCYGGTLVQHGAVTLLGSGSPLTNAHVDEDGNAELGLRLLGARSRLVWYLPSVGDPALDGAQQPFADLIPKGWVFGAVQAGIAAALFALWRARRLGPVVTERLPVVVRAAEATEGRARLYRRAGAAGHAGEVLREAGRARLRTALGLPVDAGPEAVATSASARTGRPVAEVGAVLSGPPPADDAALVRLADALDDLEQPVGRA
jgi:hypothetical protein